MFTIRYGKTMVSCAALAVAALLVTLVLTHTGPAKPRPAPKPPLEVELSRNLPDDHQHSQPELQGRNHALQAGGFRATRIGYSTCSVRVPERFVAPWLRCGNRLYRHREVAS